jgi:RHS repeat-associated protein
MIGERFDPETGLQYLNARYYDPGMGMGMGIQPDWWEVTKPGVGTNRYAYSFGDPVNKMDPGGILGLIAVGMASLELDLSTRPLEIKGLRGQIELSEMKWKAIQVDNTWSSLTTMGRLGFPIRFSRKTGIPTGRQLTALA